MRRRLKIPQMVAAPIPRARDVIWRVWDAFAVEAGGAGSHSKRSTTSAGHRCHQHRRPAAAASQTGQRTPRAVVLVAATIYDAAGPVVRIGPID